MLRTATSARCHDLKQQRRNMLSSTGCSRSVLERSVQMAPFTLSRRFSNAILVTGAAGQLGAVARIVTSLLRERGFPVRTMVHREDARAEALRAAGAEVVIGD